MKQQETNGKEMQRMRLSKDGGKTVDEMLERVGQMGRFQTTRLAMYFLILCAPTFQFLNMFFLAAEPPWQCVRNSSACKLNGSFMVGDADYDFRCKINRSEWEYARYEGPHESIVSEFDLVCDYAVYGSLATSMNSLGEVVSTVPLGLLSDHYGRRWVVFPCLLLTITVGFASSFSTKYWHFLVSRFFGGGVLLSLLCSIDILAGEAVGSRRRPLVQNTVWIACSSNLLILTLMAYFVRTWRLLMIVCTAPWTFVFVFAKFTPESTRWYLTHGQVKEAEKNLRQIAKVNRKEYPDEKLKIPEFTNEGRRFNCLALFSSATLTISALIQCFAWFSNGLVYFGASYGASDFGGNMYVNFALASVVEIPAHLLSTHNCKRIGRKKSVILYMILGGIACVIVSLIPAGTERTDFIAGRILGGMLGKGFITASYDSVIVWSTELFPTIVRNSGMGLAAVSACIGSAAAPFVLELDRIHPILPFAIMGCFAVGAALLCCVLPETRGRPTAEVYENNNNEKTARMVVLERSTEEGSLENVDDLKVAQA